MMHLVISGYQRLSSLPIDRFKIFGDVVWTGQRNPNMIAISGLLGTTFRVGLIAGFALSQVCLVVYGSNGIDQGHSWSIGQHFQL